MSHTPQVRVRQWKRSMFSFYKLLQIKPQDWFQAIILAYSHLGHKLGGNNSPFQWTPVFQIPCCELDFWDLQSSKFMQNLPILSLIYLLPNTNKIYHSFPGHIYCQIPLIFTISWVLFGCSASGYHVLCIWFPLHHSVNFVSNGHLSKQLGMQIW